MIKGNLVNPVLLVIVVYLILTGIWALAVSGAILVQIGRIAAKLIERRSRPLAADPEPQVQ